MSHTVYLGLGTNLGDRLANLQAAIEGLSPQVCLTSASPVYETEPWGVADQPMFLNQVIRVETELSPLELFHKVKGLEQSLGRVPGERFGPRLIDIDILFYDDLILEHPRLVIPHPRMLGRAFVLVPLADLAPDLIHPLERETISQLLESCDLSTVQRYSAKADEG